MIAILKAFLANLNDAGCGCTVTCRCGEQCRCSAERRCDDECACGA